MLRNARRPKIIKSWNRSRVNTEDSPVVIKKRNGLGKNGNTGIEQQVKADRK